MSVQPFVDLRSDTVTLPTPEMKAFMINAPLGDDVLGEDPTVRELEQYTARITGMESALFVPSGTMANQIAVRVYGGPGTEILVVDQSHVFFYEGGGAAGLSGTQIHIVPAMNGLFDVESFRARIRREDDHFPETRLFWIENTHNRGGGAIVPLDRMMMLRKLSIESGVPVHMDGARLVNAAIATGVSLDAWAAQVDSLSLCLSKGLGAPVGSLLAGSDAFIRRARKVRKMFGGGMRQAGIIAAAGLYAFMHHMERLADDHRNARLLRDLLAGLSGLTVPDRVDTNMVMIDLDPALPIDAQSMQEALEQNGVAMFAIGPRRLRAVTHLGITESDIIATAEAFRKLIPAA